MWIWPAKAYISAAILKDDILLFFFDLPAEPSRRESVVSNIVESCSDGFR